MHNGFDVYNRPYRWVLLLMVSQLAVLAVGFLSPTPAGIVFLGSLFLLILLLLHTLTGDSFSLLGRLFFFAFIFRCLVTLWGELYVGGAPDDRLIFPDARGYDFSAAFIARLWEQGEPADVKFFARGVATGYYYLVSVVYFLFGHSILLAKLFNCLIGALVVVYVYLVGKEVFDERAATLGAWIACFSPGLAWWSSCLLKDTLVSFLLIASYYHLVRARARPVHLLVCAATLFLLFFTRFYVFGIFLVLGGVWFLAAARRRRGLYVLLGLGMVVLGFVEPLVSVLDQSRLLRLPEFLQIMNAGGALDRSSFVARFALGEWRQILAFIPVGAARFLFGPLPWKLEGIYQILMPSILLRYVLLPFFLIALVKSFRRFSSPRWLAGALIVCLILVYAVIFRGSAGRRYAQMLGFVFLLASSELIALGFRDVKVVLFYVGFVVGGSTFLIGIRSFGLVVGVLACSLAGLLFLRRRLVGSRLWPSSAG